MLSKFWQKCLERLPGIDPFDAQVPVMAPRDVAGFSISLLALFAKLAKADGRIDLTEVRCIRTIMTIDPQDEVAAARVFNLCGKDPSGFEVYAARINRAIGNGPGAEDLRGDVFEALMLVAAADGKLHEDERRILDRCAEIFMINPRDIKATYARHIPDQENPWAVLGIPTDSEPDVVKRAWRALVKKEHPDAAIARGLPPMLIEIATRRLTEINRAYDSISNLNAKNEFCIS